MNAYYRSTLNEIVLDGRDLGRRLRSGRATVTTSCLTADLFSAASGWATLQLFR